MEQEQPKEENEQILNWSQVLQMLKNKNNLPLKLIQEDTRLEVSVASEVDYELLHLRNKGSYSPFLCGLSFAALQLKNDLLKAIYTCGFVTPTKLQRYLLPVILNYPSVDVYVQSEWDTGKRTAFLIALLNTIDSHKAYPQAICLSSKYELCIQNAEYAAKMATFYPSVSFYTAVEETIRGTYGHSLSAHIIFGTPECVVDLIIKWKAFAMNKIKILILQDVEYLCTMPAYHERTYYINQCVSQNCQKIFFTSVFNSDLNVRVASMMSNLFIIKTLRTFNKMLDNVTQFNISCQGLEEKYNAVATICATYDDHPILIYCSTAEVARKLAVKMILDKFDVAASTCNLTPLQRMKVYKQFQNENRKILIATDILARGIHLNEFSVVCNYDMPSSKNFVHDYVNRVTRTGNAYKKGVVLNLVDPEMSFLYCQTIEDTFHRKIIKIKISDIRNIYGAQVLLDISNS